jgi:hypothetical protein
VVALPHKRALVRISKHDSGEPFFGRSGDNRFDSPDGSFGTCYCGFTLACAFGETVLHDKAIKPGGGFDVPLVLLERRWVVSLAHTGLRLAHLRGTDLLPLGADGTLSTTMPHDLPHLWSKAVYDHPGKVDGIIYTSRRVNDEAAVVLFDRAAHLVSPVKYRRYLSHPGRAAVHTKLKVSVV